VRHELLKRTQFLEDYREKVEYLAEANVLAADRFCDAVESALEVLALHPEIGPKAGFPKAPEIRFWPLRRFPKYLILYRVFGSSIVLVRLLHSSRDVVHLSPGD
jgi:plasmid stabilization system protein ParE